MNDTPGRWYPQLAAALAIGVGGAALAGWTFDISVLKSVLPGWVAMKPNTAIAFVLTGLALLLSSRPPSALVTRLARLCALLAGIIGLLTLSEYAFGWNPGIDQWLFREPAGAVGTSHPGRMAPDTALSFVLLATALLAPGAARRTRWTLTATVIVGALVAALGLVAMLSYVTAGAAANGWGGLTLMAVPTAAVFMLLGAVVALGAWRDALGHGLTRFANRLWQTGSLVVALAIAFVLYARSQAAIQRAADLRYRSYVLADELRQSGDDLTRMVRTYVVTGDPIYRQRFQDILDIRDGRKPRPEDYSRPYWDLVLPGRPAPRADSRQAIPLLELMLQAGFTEEEFRKLAEAKANSDALTAPEFEAMRLVESAGPVAEANRARATRMLYDARYQQAKASVMGPIHDFFVLLDSRTLAAVRAAETKATILRYVFAAIGLWLLFAIWRTYVALGDTLGGSVDEVHAHIATIGKGDFSAAIQIKEGLESSVLGWLSETQAKLNEADRRRNEAEERIGSEKLLSDSLINSLPGVLYLFDEHGRFLRWNRNLERVTGYSAEEMAALSPLDFFVGEERALIQQRIQAVFADGQADAEADLVSKGGGRTPYYLTGLRLEYNGRPCLIGVGVDITEPRRAGEEIRRLNQTLEQRVIQRTAELETANTQLRAERSLTEAIRQAQARFIASDSSQQVFDDLLQSLIDQTGSEYGFIDEMFFDPDGKPYLTARAITDISWNEETRGMYAKFVSGELSFTKLESLFGTVMTTGKPVIANDAPHDPRRGGVPPGHPALNAFLGLPLHSNSRLVGVVGLANRPGGYSEALIAHLDPLVQACASLLSAWRGERKRAEAEAALAKGAAQLEAANKELEAFSYSVSHDLRAPLRAIDGYGRILTEDYESRLDPEGRRILGVISSETRRMGELVDDLLAFSQLGRRSLVSQDINMTALCRAVFDEQAALAPNRILQLELKPLPPARGDRAMIRVVLSNLLSNAVKFTKHRDPAAIEVGSRHEDGQVVYHVKDNGVGFDMTYAHKLFGVFQRLHSTEEFEGTGVGLALVQRVIHRHGGRVWAEGEVNDGATFYFTLPNEQGSP